MRRAPPAFLALLVAAACGSSGGAAPESDSGLRDTAAADAGTELGYPDPRTVGFHHAALMYKGETPRTAASFAPYVARQGQWLFDAFVFLSFTSPRGIALDYGASTQSDWEALLDAWFGADSARGEAGALDDAVAHAGSPPSARRIVIVMPWMNPGVTDFGDVDGDGQREDLSRTADRVRVAKWYAAKVRERFAARHYANLELWGLYFMREDIVRDDALALPEVTAAVRAEGLRTMWIPYYAAPGWDAWQSLGFDVAILQPSYAFRSWLDAGRATRSRLHAAADLARSKGLGIEVEARGERTLPFERTMLRHYLADGAAFGYQQGATAYFLGGGNVVEDELAAYVRGEPVADPDPAASFSQRTSDDGRTLTAHATLGNSLDVRGVHVDVDDAPDRPWAGTATVRVRRSGATALEPAGWALRGSPDGVAGPMRWQTLTIPVPSLGLAPVVELEVELVTAAHSPVPKPPPIVRITPDTDFAPQTDAPGARGAAYTVQPPPASSSMPDAVPPKLTDGLVSEGGWNTGRAVGWGRDPGELAVTFDLGKPRAFSRVRVYSHGGSDSAVNWPLNPAVLLAPDAPRVAPEGIAFANGAPAALSALAGSAPVVTGKHGPWCKADDGFAHCTDLDGYIEFASPAPIASRYLTLFTEAKGWALLTEVQIEADGELLRNVPYAIRTHPSPSPAPPYWDDARRLTDGTIATDFLPGLVSGWPATTPVQVEVRTPNDLREVTVWSQSIPSLGIDAPATVRVETSPDGNAFALLGQANADQAIAVGGARGYRVMASALVHARVVRVSIAAHGSANRWTMLSEIDVR